MATNFDITADIDNFLEEMNQEVENLDTSVTDALSYMCKKVIEDARRDGNYTDRTGNLRHSLGYGIIDNGQIIEQSVNTEIKENNNSAEAIQRESENMQNVKGAVIVSGMKYASYVEAKGFDVLSGFALNMEEYFREGLE